MAETNMLEKTAVKETEPWSNFPNYPLVPGAEMSRIYGWLDIPKDGGGDIDLADYALDID